MALEVRETSTALSTIAVVVVVAAAAIDVAANHVAEGHGSGPSGQGKVSATPGSVDPRETTARISVGIIPVWFEIYKKKNYLHNVVNIRYCPFETIGCTSSRRSIEFKFELPQIEQQINKNKTQSNKKHKRLPCSTNPFDPWLRERTHTTLRTKLHLFNLPFMLPLILYFSFSCYYCLIQ